MADGAVLHPDDRTWTTLSDSPLSPRWAIDGTWTGSELVIGGAGIETDGEILGAESNDGARYCVSQDTWKRRRMQTLAAQWSLHGFGAAIDPSAEVASRVNQLMYQPPSTSSVCPVIKLL